MTQTISRLRRDLGTEGVEPVARRLAATLTPQECLARLRSAPPLVRKRPEQGVTELTDGLGRRGTVHFAFPAGRTRSTVVLLHGARGNGRQMLELLGERAAAAGIALVAPDALPPVEEHSRQDWFAGPIGERDPIPMWRYATDDLPSAAAAWSVATMGSDPRRIALVGLSMGAFAAWNLAMREPGRYAGIVALAGAISRWEFVGTDRTARFLLRNALNVPLSVCHGTDDAVVPLRMAESVVQDLQALGHTDLDVEILQDVGHELWLPDLPRVQRHVVDWLTHRRRTEQHAFTHCVVGRQDARHRFVEVLAGETAGTATVTCARISDDHYVCTTTGPVAGLRILLGSPTLAAGSVVTVQVDGRTRTHVHRPSLRTLLGSYARDADPWRAYTDVVHVPLDPSRTEQPDVEH